MTQSVSSYLSLGSNVGDTYGYLRDARQRLSTTPQIRLLKQSPLYRTAPVGKIDQDWFLNQVVQIETTLAGRELLTVCQRIEVDLGRVRHERWGPRTLDIDILLYGNEQSTDPVLTLPHPRLLERAFVLVPLADIAPDLDIAGRAVTEHLAALSAADRAGVELSTER